MVPPCIPTPIILSSKILFLWICIFKPSWPCSVTKLALHSLWLQVREKIGLSTQLPPVIVLEVAEIHILQDKTIPLKPKPDLELVKLFTSVRFQK